MVTAPLLSCFVETLAAKGKSNARCLGAGKEAFERNRPGIAIGPQTVQQRRHFRGHPRLAAAEQTAGPVNQLQIAAQRESFDQSGLRFTVPTAIFDRAKPQAAFQVGCLTNSHNHTGTCRLQVDF